MYESATFYTRKWRLFYAYMDCVTTNGLSTDNFGPCGAALKRTVATCYHRQHASADLL